MIIATVGLPNFEQIERAEIWTSSWDAINSNSLLRERVIIYDGTGGHFVPIVAESVRLTGKSVSHVIGG